MKIKISNLGPIKEQQEFNLKPFTILIGPNNSGKTWLTYLLAAIFSIFGWQKYTTEEDTKSILSDYPELEKTVDTVLKTGAATLDFYQFAEKYGEIYFNKVAERAHEWFADFMGTQRTTFHDLKIAINLAETKQLFLEQAHAASLDLDLDLTSQKSGAGTSGPLLGIDKKPGQKELRLYTFSREQLSQQFSGETATPRLMLVLLLTLHTALYSGVTVLPPERTTLISCRTSLLEMVRALEERLNQRSATSSFPRPVGVYLSSVVSSFGKGPQDQMEREKRAKQDPRINAYMELSSLLQEKILAGTVDFSDAQPGTEREIIFQPTTGSLPLDISLASSMVKELAPLVFYLRYSAKPGDLLIIDEPEMNLHPRAQVQILEFLAMLVNAGLHVLITTHSPYIIDHIDNLFLASKHEDQGAISSEFFLQDKRAFIPQENTAVYLVDDGKITDALEEREGDTFGDISDHISEIFFKL